VDRIDRIVSNESLMQMMQRLDALQAELRVQQGRIEELQNENELLKRQQRDLYADLDKRLQAAPAGGGTAATGADAAGIAAAPPRQRRRRWEQAQYTRAFEALKARNYAAATEGFRSRRPPIPMGNWLTTRSTGSGSRTIVTQEYDHAAAAFQRVLTGWRFPEGPDAMLKLGYTQIEQKKLAAGRTTLEQVVAKYPDSMPRSWLRNAWASCQPSSTALATA
jgi:TolA-binding protein